jgi:hypothetical protein
MKTFVKPIVAGLLASSTFLMNPVLASEKNPIDHKLVNRVISDYRKSFTLELYQVSNSETIRAIIGKPEGKNLFVTLRDPQGFQLYKFFTAKKNNRIDKDFDFSEAEQGVYTLEVSDGETKVVKQIKLQRAKAEEVTKLMVE